MNNADTITQSVFDLQDHHVQASQDLTVLSMLRIALTVRELMPGAAEIGLAWSDQGPFLVPAGEYLAADGAPLDAPGDLDALIAYFCGNLTDETEGTWMLFVSGADPGSMYRLKIDDVLAACELAPAGSRSLAPGAGLEEAAGIAPIMPG